MEFNGLTPIISALLSGTFGIVGTLTGIYYQRRSERNRQMTEKVYEPLYNELAEAKEGKLPFDNQEEGFHSYWIELDHFWRSKVEKELRKDIDAYTEKLEVANSALEIMAEEIIENRSDLHDVWTSGRGNSEYAEIKLLFRESHSGNRKTSVSMIHWFSEYYEAIYTTNNPEELREQLESLADLKSPEHRRAIDSWSDDNLRALGRAIYKADIDIEYPDNISSTSELIENIQKESIELAERINRKANSLF